jgi:hypothetical protein
MNASDPFVVETVSATDGALNKGMAVTATVFSQNENSGLFCGWKIQGPGYASKWFSIDRDQSELRSICQN